MRFEWLIEFRINELEKKFFVDLGIGLAMFIIGAFYDRIADKLVVIRHSTEGFPLWQVLWCGFWGMYIIWTLSYLKNWRDR